MPQYQTVLHVADLDGDNGFRIIGVTNGFDSGFSVSDAGDVNGDGVDDLLVGARYGDVAYVVFGDPDGFGASLQLSSLDGNNGFRIANGGAPFNFAQSVSSAGDVNGDGFDDVIAGSKSADGNAGASFVVFGHGGAFSDFDISALDGNNGFRLSGAAALDYSGFSLSGAGDINGDGFDDVLVGAPTADNYNGTAGVAYVVFGAASGFAADIDLSSLDGTNGFALRSQNPTSLLGYSVSTAGDVNGDGLDDIIAGGNGGGTSFACVVFGSTTPFAANVSASSLDGNDGFIISGTGIGQSVSTAGDINSDGVDDMIVAGSGAAYVVFGKATGFGSNIQVASLTGGNGFKIDGATRVSSAGDFNGDGFGDLLVSAPGVGAGRSYVVFGKANGFVPDMNAADLDGNNGFRFDGEDSSDSSGFSISAAGDVNGDGLADIIVGAPENGSKGASYVIYGALPGEDVVRIGTGIANTIHGGNFDDELSGLSGDDTLFGHEGDDTIKGGSGDDASDMGGGDDVFRGGSGIDDAHGDDGADELHGGSGNDTLSGEAGGDVVDGGSGDDTLFGSTGGDRLVGGDGKDTLDGGTEQDIFIFRLASELTSTGYDILQGANFAADLFDVNGNITAIDATITTGRLKSNKFDHDVGVAADAAHLGARHAVLFTASTGNFAGKTFLAVDQNGIAGYQAGADLVMELVTPTNILSLDAGDFI